MIEHYSVVTITSAFLEKHLKIDDPVGAFAVHGACGVWGTLAVGLFGNLEKIGSGLSRLEQIGIQALGTGTYIIWPLITGGIMYYILKKCKLLRVDQKEELIGLDESEHGNDAYSGFQIFPNS